MLIISLACMTACGEKDGSGYLFRYSLSSDPKNLDPQLATDRASLTVIQNIYTGLFRISEGGALINGAVSEYKVSSDGLVYEFTLREDNYWAGTDKNNTPQVTAYDFEYAFQRIFNSITSSPYRENFSCIKNAEKIISGEADYKTIGVTAVSDFKLKIELDYADANFLSSLATSAAMPCNSKFFYTTGGKYGLDAENTLCNGPFYVKQWEYDPYGKNNHLILRKNGKYSETDRIYPSSLNFFIDKDYDERKTDFTKENTDCIVVDGNEKSLLKGKYSYTEYQATSYGLVFNREDERFKDDGFRKALALSLNRLEFSDEIMMGRTPAYAVVPSGVTMLNKSYRELCAETAISVFDETTAASEWQAALERNGIATVDRVNILVCDSFVNDGDLSCVTEQWQRRLGFFCGIEVVPKEEYQRRISEGEYTIALFEVNSDINNPVGFLEKFGTEKNSFGYSNAEFDDILARSKKMKNLSECVELYSEAEKILVDDFAYIPVFYQSKFLVYSDEIEGIAYNPFTEQVEFINAKNYD